MYINNAMSHWLFGAVTLDILDAKIKHTAELGKTSFGHDGEIYTNLRSVTRSDGTTGYRFDHEDNESYVKSYFIKNDGTWLFVTERGHPTVSLRFDAPFDENDTLGGRFNELNDALDESVFNARLGAAIQNYELTGEPQDFKWRGNSYTNLQDTGKSTVDYRFDHGSGDDRKAFFFAEDGSHVFGWSKTGGGQSYHHPDKTETDSLYDRLVEVDEKLPLSHEVPLTLEEHLAKLEDDPDGLYGFQIADRDMLASLSENSAYDYQLITDYDFVNSTRYSHPVFLSDDGTAFFISTGDDYEGIHLAYQWGWAPTNGSELGELLYGNGLKDTLYGRVQAIEYDTNATIDLYHTAELSGFLTFTASINQAPDSDAIKIGVVGEARGLLGYNELTTLEGIIHHDLNGSEIQSINFTSEAYDFLGYGEVSTIKGVINQESIGLTLESYDALGYGETIVVDLVINERRSGYGVSLDINVDSSLVSVDCTANAVVGDDLTVSSLDVNCSDDDLESDIEDTFDELLDSTFEELDGWEEGLQETLNLVVDEVDIVDETLPEYVGAFAPVDNDDWFI